MTFTVVKKIEPTCICDGITEGVPPMATEVGRNQVGKQAIPFEGVGSIIECDECGAQYIHESTKEDDHRWVRVGFDRQISTNRAEMVKVGRHAWSKSQKPFEVVR